MESEQSEALRRRLEDLVRERWGEQDPAVQVSSVLRAGGKIDMTVISDLFAGKDGLEREAFFWPVFDPVPKSELIYMTYCLLLTPEEASLHFTRSSPSATPTDDWE